LKHPRVTWLPADFHGAGGTRSSQRTFPVGNKKAFNNALKTVASDLRGGVVRRACCIRFRADNHARHAVRARRAAHEPIGNRAHKHHHIHAAHQPQHDHLGIN
jgi:hypothetical protein